ncbi:low-affinity glucose transporter HXT3 [Penicillium verhagenii]|uniref:low-affinity glucose transporter HXT3 n=1 Tax=Penicillium verhagenii TaxID=1562060 RepID=UPI002545AAE9|nr:low-affinity glucose transporter HXT3 [Penicillium verhagenii]KAJ5948368.1 low-affinity glucose transporter HXT3 [Penicillium verhagenii]
MEKQTTTQGGNYIPHDQSIFRYLKAEPQYARYIPGGFSPSRCMSLQGKAMTYAIFLFSGCAILFFGYDTAVMSQVNDNNDYLQMMGIAGGNGRDAAAVGGLVSLWFGGFALGALIVGYIADSIGRLKTIQIGCLWGILGAALLATAQDMSWFAFARVISGIGCGHLNTIVPVWTSELADPHLRGAFVAVQFTLAMVGSRVAYWMEFGCTKTQSLSFSWRFPLGFQIVFLIFILLAAPFYPESPRHLAKIGDLEGARSVLEKCRVEADEQQIETEMQEIISAIRAEATSTSHSFYSMLFTKDKKHTRRRVIIGAGVQVMQKLTGIDFIAVYAPDIFSLSGFKGDKPALLAGGNWFGYIVSLALSIFLCDRVGRRKLMLIGCLLMGIVLIIGGVLSHETISHTDNDPVLANKFGSGVAAILYIYTFIYGSTWLTTCWVYPTEVFPLASRSKGAALATFAFSIAGGTINIIILYLIDAISFWVFILFALINLALLVPIYLFYVETANRHLEQLDILFSSDSCLSWRAERHFTQKMTKQRGTFGEDQEKGSLEHVE